MFRALKEYGKAKEYLEKALAISKEIGDRYGEGTCYKELGNVFLGLHEFDKAKEYLEEAVAIIKEIGDRNGEGTCYRELGNVFQAFGEYGKAKEYLEKALAISKEIGDKKGEVEDYRDLGALFHSLAEHDKAKEYCELALAVSEKIGNVETELRYRTNLAVSIYLGGNEEEAFPIFLECLNNLEEMRALLKENDEFKVSFSDLHAFSFEILCVLLCGRGNFSEALYVVELWRARALADLMSVHYCIENQISANPETWLGIERIMDDRRNCVCLFIYYDTRNISLWILRPEEKTLFRQTDVNTHCDDERSIRNLDKFLRDDITFRKFHILPPGQCEDRSLGPSGQPVQQSSQGDSPAAFRLVEEDEEEDQEPEPSLSFYYKLIIAPVADLLVDEREIIIVPDRSLYSVPFAALKNERGDYLSQTFRIRIVPSLTTLKLIQDSPADNHSQTADVLIVGEPKVGHAFYKGCIENFCPLPGARREAEMIGRLLGAQPLIGQYATKQAVLQRINSVSLIHIAAHGNAERGEIALAPLHPTGAIPQEEDYLLTMSDISQVRLQAKLVVLSCCHSGRGRIRSEGVVGIARAFLGSGARSVLVALWALSDSATEQLMSRFYEHMVLGESASESLHQAMRWMRGNGYPDVRDWAPFMLLGDDVAFDFKK